jgi:hypothetical protein
VPSVLRHFFFLDCISCISLQRAAFYATFYLEDMIQLKSQQCLCVKESVRVRHRPTDLRALDSCVAVVN